MSFDDLYEDNVTVFGMDDVLTFGKYKGETVRQIAETDPRYLRWAFDNIDWFDLDEEVQEEVL